MPDVVETVGVQSPASFLSKETALNIVAGGGLKYRKTARVMAVKMDQVFTIDQRGVVVTGKPGDYLCVDAGGEPYVCSADVFEKSYVLVQRVRGKNGAEPK